MLVGQGVVPAWMVAAIVVREVLITGLRQAAIERGVVLAARDLGKLKTWAQAVAAAVARVRGRRRLDATAPPGGRCSSPSSSPGCRGSTTPAARRALLSRAPARVARAGQAAMPRCARTTRRSGPTRAGTREERRTPPRPRPGRPSGSGRSSPDRRRPEPRCSGCTPPTCGGNDRLGARGYGSPSSSSRVGEERARAQSETAGRSARPRPRAPRESPRARPRRAPA